MTDDEARRLATRIIDTWPNGPRHYIWRDLITHYNHHLAQHTYQRLQHQLDRPPTTGQFHATYRALERGAQTPDQPELEEATLSRNEYLQRVAERARNDPAAADELEHWRRLHQHKMLV